MHKNKWMLLFTSLFICLFFKSPAQETYTYTNPGFKYQKALELFNAEKYGSAIKLFDELKGEITDKNSYMYIDAQYYSAISSSFLYNRDAEYKIRKFIDLYPEDSRNNLAFFYLGNSLYSQKKYRESLSAFQKINEVNLPDNLMDEYRFKTGYCYFLDSNYTKAKDLFIQVKETPSAYASPATYYYAHILYLQKDYTLALIDFEKLKDDKNFGEIVPFYITHIYFLLGKYDDLLKYAPGTLQKASPKRESEISRMIGEAYYYKSDYQNALKYLAPSIEKNPMPSDQDLYSLGYCYYQLKEYSAAKSYFVRLNSSYDSLAQNAMYHLADCYLKEKDKQAARTAFLKAYTLDFDSKITEDALFNYAKLSFEIPNNPFNEALKAFQEYQTKYPNSTHKNEIHEIMANLYFSIRNYKDALEMVEKISPKSKAVNEAYQRIALNRGIEVFNEDKLEESINLFDKVIINDFNDNLTASAYYLRAEAYYRLQNYYESESNLKQFFISVGGTQSPYFSNACYTMGYSYLKLRNYEKSIDYFKRFINAEKEKKSKIVADAYNRVGDGYFITKKFNFAIEEYNKNIELNLFDVDYALYQKALSVGALGKYENKITLLNTLINRFPASAYNPSAYYEMANTYLILENNEQALSNYNLLVKKYPNSIYVKEVSLKMGMIQYTQGHDEDALKSLDKVAKTYPNTTEAYDALGTIKNIYVAQNRLDEYFNYVKNIPQAQVSTAGKDSLIYNVAEGRYLEGDCDGAIKGFEDYLDKYPDGLFALNANYYKADCHFRQGKFELALPNYESVIEQPKSKYTEKSLLNAASISFDFKEFKKAHDYYVLLEQYADAKTNKYIAKQGIMRSLYAMQDYNATVQAAEHFLQSEKISDEAIDEANHIMARSYYIVGDTINARIKFRSLIKSKNGEFAGEANYHLAEMLYREKRLNDAEKGIIAITANPTSEYWLAKSFVLWAQIYEDRGNLFQAKQTLQSIIDNYDGKELVNEAQERLNAIHALEEKQKEEKEKQADKKREDVEIIDIKMD